MYLDIRKTYREILQEELDDRIKKNSMYSLRAFAKDLDIYPSRLSDVLKGKYGLSRVSAIKIAQRLKFNDEEIACFCDLVDSLHARSKIERTLANKRLLNYKKQQQYNELTFDFFRVIKDWYHYAILELTYLEGFQSNTKWISKKLAISEIEAKQAIDRLIKIEMLTFANGVYKAVEDFTATTSDIPSKALKQFHSQLIQKAGEALEQQKVENRDITAIVMSIKKENISKAKKLIKSFRREFDQLIGQDDQRDAVYCLGVHFYELTKDME